MLFLLLYPFDLCISITFIFLFLNILSIDSKSNSLSSFKSTCSKFILYDFKELGLSTIPITSSNVSYGLPVMLSNVSPGLSNENSATVKAWVPEINCPLTIQSSVLNISENTFSQVSLPMSPYPYPVVLLKCISEKHS